MTYDAGTDTITTSENLNADEQDSLEVGEALQNEHDNLILGKYKNAEELERAHVELERKLGERSGEDSDDEYEDPEAGYEEEEYEEEADDEDYDFSVGADLIAEASTEFAETGEISLETMEAFADMSSQELVEAYVELQDAIEQDSAPVELSDREVSSVQEIVGGEEQYQNLIGWANENMPQETIEAFDDVINTGSLDAIALVVSGLKSQYDSVNGYEGRMLSGKPPSGSGEVFRSQAEVVNAMSDPRYDDDPAYRQALIQKLDRSDISF